MIYKKISIYLKEVKPNRYETYLCKFGVISLILLDLYINWQ